jgi:hypothetical protein
MYTPVMRSQKPNIEFLVSVYVALKDSEVYKEKVWSSGTIKNVHHQVEADMQQTIPMTLIDEIHDGEHVDGVKFDVAAIFEYILLKSLVFQKKRRIGW